MSASVRDGVVGNIVSALASLVIVFAALGPASAQTPTSPLAAMQPAGEADGDLAAPGAPKAGANSFTESQAKNRLEAHGFSDISQLAQDGNGIWRGTAIWRQKRIAVAVDFQGSIVAR